jgi:hypothetical protein
MAIAQPTPVKQVLWHFRAYRVISGVILLTLVSLIFLWIHAIFPRFLLVPGVECDQEEALN